MEVAIAYKHTHLERAFTQLCEDRGYEVVDVSYHHNFPEDSCDMLRKCDAPASLSIRLNPDLLVIKDGQATLYELKTGNRDDKVYLEAYQLMINQIRQTCLNVPCIYVYRGVITDWNMVACPVADIKINSLVIPTRKSNSELKYMLEHHFQCESKEREVKYPYSGDPYVEVTAEEIQKWQPIDNFIRA